jgi:NADH pyrophosphatase NudC (nudix superfamily)
MAERLERIQEGESYQETAVREVFEKTGATISDIEYVGHYVVPTGQTTAMTCAKALPSCLKQQHRF